MKQRKEMTTEFLNSPFYKNYFEPAIQTKIENADSIMGINDKSIEKDYLLKKNKISVLRGVLNMLKEWSEEKEVR